MILGYFVSGPDNDSFLNEGLYGKNISECLIYIKNRENFISPDFKIKRTNFDFSFTYDGALIVSYRFKDFCNRQKFEHLEFFKLSGQPDFYLFKVNKIIGFDTNRRKTKFLEYNKNCNEYNEVVGATPVCLIENKSLEDGFYRTDIEFGRGFAKHPLILLGLNSYELLKKEKIKGIYFKEILDKYDWEK